MKVRRFDMKNRQAYMVGLNKMEIRETAVPEPKELDTVKFK